MNFKLKTAALAAISAGALAGAMFASAATQVTAYQCNDGSLVTNPANCQTVTNSANCYQFGRNLSVGSSGSDVMQLQKSLNSMGFTIASTGAGSPGNETSYFGVMTKGALAKWQEAHTAEVLAPWGLTKGTGYLGTESRKFMNSNGCSSNNNGNNNNGGTTTNGNVSVSLSNSQPNNVLVQSSVNATLANFNFSGTGIVTGVKLNRIGVSNYDSVSNVYLYDTNTGARLTDGMTMLSNGTVSFVNGMGLFTVNGSRSITVKADIAATTSGQSIGVALTGFTLSGSAEAAVSGLNGPALPIGSADIVSVELATTTSVASNIDAGRQNVVFWEATSNTTKDSYMSGAIFSFIGSAPYTAFSNVKLYVDGAQVGNAMAIDATGKITFVGSSFVKAGQHTISLRGDITDGAGRDYYVRLEDGGLMFEDANIRGVYGAITKKVGFSMRVPTTGNVGINSCNSANCAVWTSDSSFSNQKVVSGSSNQTIGKYTLKAVGESQKLLSGSLKITGSPNTGDIRNVSVYVNGVQVVSGRTVSLDGTTPLTLSNLGSAVINLGTVATIEIKADIASSTGVALTTNSLKTNFTVDVQGMDSKNSTSLSAIDSNSVSVGTMNANFANNSNFTGAKATSNQSGVKVGSFLLSTGNESVRLTSLNVTLTPGNGLNMSNVSNFRLMDGTTQVWSQSNLGSANTPAVVSASPYVEVGANTTKTYDVLVDFNNAGATGTLAVTGTAAYQGTISLSSQAANQALAAQNTTLATPALASVVKSASSLSNRYVVGGSLGNTAVFTLKASGASFTTSKLQVTVSNPSTVGGVTIAGATAQQRAGGVYTADISKEITTIGTDIIVNVTFNSANRDTNTLHGATTSIALSYVGSTDNGFTNVGTEDTASTTVISGGNSSDFTLVGAYPQVKMSDNSTTRSPGTVSNVAVGTIQIAPSTNGVVQVTQVGVNLSSLVSGMTARVVDTSGNVVSGASIATTTGIVTLPATNISSLTKYIIQVSGTIGGSTSVDIGANLGNVSDLKWLDVTGTSSVTLITGSSLIPNWNTNW